MLNSLYQNINAFGPIFFLGTISLTPRSTLGFRPFVKLAAEAQECDESLCVRGRGHALNFASPASPFSLSSLSLLSLPEMQNIAWGSPLTHRLSTRS